MARFAAPALGGVLVVGALAVVAMRFGEPLWALTAPADRLAVLVSPVDLKPVAGRPPDHVVRDRLAGRSPDRAAAASRTPKAADSTAEARATTSATALEAGATGDGWATPSVRLGTRMTVTEPAPTEMPDDVAVSSEPGAPTFTTDVQGGRTVYRMNGDLLLDPGHLRGEPVEVGFEYRFGQRGLEKVTLWEVRR
jgi:hypothetical protein